jgi:hypothetical protein
MAGLGESSFYRQNRALLAALLGIPIFLATAGAFTDTVANPVAPTRFNIASTSNSNLRFWIVTRESYSATLWMQQPVDLDRETFDMITGCMDYSIGPQLRVQTPIWTIRSARDQRIAVQREAILIDPPANECSSTTGGHVFSLGEFVLAPGRYQFELRLGNDIPESINFPVELNIQCCGKLAAAHTILGGLPLFFGFFLSPVLVLIFAFLALSLFVRSGKFLYSSCSK